MTRNEPVLSAAAKGAIAGLAGTAALTAGMQAATRLMTRLGYSSPAPQTPEGGEPTEKMAQQVATHVADTRLSEASKETAGQAIHWGYGAMWGAIYGMAQSRLQLPHVLHGALFGSLVGTVASTVVPAMRLSPPPTEQSMPKNGVQLALHLVYGWVTALVFHALSR